VLLPPQTVLEFSPLGRLVEAVNQGSPPQVNAEPDEGTSSGL